MTVTPETDMRHPLLRRPATPADVQMDAMLAFGEAILRAGKAAYAGNDEPLRRIHAAVTAPDFLYCDIVEPRE